MRNKLASIIIITRNRLDYTKLCIQSILDKTLYKPYEIIVVDNNSTDGTVEWLQSMLKGKKIKEAVFLPENYGAAYAINVGIKKAKGEYLIRSDNDMVYNQGWLTELVKAMERIPRSILQVAVFGELVEDGRKGGFSEEINGVTIKQCDIGGCNMAFTRKTYLKLGPFPDVMFAEDCLYCQRAKGQGYIVGQISDAVGTHIDHPGCSLSRRYSEYASYRLEGLDRLREAGVGFLFREDEKFYEEWKGRDRTQ